MRMAMFGGSAIAQRCVGEMTMRYIGSLLLATALAGGLALAQDSGKQDMKDAGSDVKQAGKDVGHSAKHAAKGVKKGTKKGAHKVASKTEEGADKVKEKTQ